MITEWSSPYNPFNSMKVMLWRNHLEGCAKEDYLIPVTVDIDPSSKCPLRCAWCNARDIIDKDTKDLPESHLLKLADFIAEWGAETEEGNPKSACIAGGGEPLMNPGTPALLERMAHNGLESGLITNGLLLDEKVVDIVAKTCRWVGISMDAATPETYMKVKFDIRDRTVKATDSVFRRVVENIKTLVEKIEDTGSKNDVAFKFLLHPLNAHEVYAAAKLAKELGVKDFHLRPVGWENITAVKNKEPIKYTQEMIQSINAQIEEARKLEDGRFKVYGIRHKFNPDFSVKRSFSRCWAIPLLPTFGADGKVYMCFDMRGRPDTVMCNHFPDVTEIARFWNSEEHHKMVREFDIKTCPRCTFTAYNEIVEQVIVEDKMCRNFP